MPAIFAPQAACPCHRRITLASRCTFHTRAVPRDGGLWDLEAELIDVKAYDFPKRDGEVFKAGDPIHHMHLRITIDGDFTIVAAHV